jgi:hypothetical protein
MNEMHYTEDDLILYYYGEHHRRVRVEQHLAECASCRSRYGDLAATLRLVADPEVPARGEPYGLEVWQRIRHQLPEQEAPWWAVWTRPNRLALAGAAAAIVLAAFIAGLSWPRADRTSQPANALVDPAPSTAPGPSDAGERVRVAAVSDHLEQSERVLLDFVNAYGTADQPADVSSQQQWAADLIDANRLYRDASTAAGDDTVAAVLDELERHLLELVHGPATLTPQELDQIRLRLDAAALLFRVRVLSDHLREREFVASPTPRNTI